MKLALQLQGFECYAYQTLCIVCHLLLRIPAMVKFLEQLGLHVYAYPTVGTNQHAQKCAT